MLCKTNWVRDSSTACEMGTNLPMRPSRETPSPEVPSTEGRHSCVRPHAAHSEAGATEGGIEVESSRL
jgi:hypothetical protein